MKKFLALILGFALIFSVFSLSGAVAASAEGTDYCIKVLGAPAPASMYNGGRLNVGVTANATYTVKFSYYYKTASGTPGFRVLNGGSSGDAKLVDYTIPSADNDAGWKTYTVNVTPTASTISVWFHNGNMSADGVFYVDDVSVVKSGETTNIFPNGDFSEALSSSWKISANLLVYSERPILNTTPSNPCAKISGTATNSAKFNGGRLNVGVTANATYTVKFSYYYKTASGTPGFRVLNGGSSGDAKLVDYTIPSADNDVGWKTYTVNVTPTASTISVWFHNGNMSADGEFYIDDVSVVKSGETANIFPNGDFSEALSSSWKISSNLLVYSERPVVETEDDTEDITTDYALQVYSEQQYKQLYQVFDVDASTDYVVKLDFKSNGTTNTQMRVYMGMGLSSTTEHKINLQDSVWTTTSYEFTTDENTQQITLSFMTTSTDKSAYTWIDNISIYKKSAETADETAVIYEEDFASGSLTGFISAGNDLSEKVFNVRNKDEYDYNADGTVDIKDLVRIARYLLDSTTQISLVADDNATIEEADIATTRTVLLERY